MSLIENLQWRHAVKALTQNQSVSQRKYRQNHRSHSTGAHLIGIAAI